MHSKKHIKPPSTTFFKQNFTVNWIGNRVNLNVVIKNRKKNTCSKSVLWLAKKLRYDNIQPSPTQDRVIEMVMYGSHFELISAKGLEFQYV